MNKQTANKSGGTRILRARCAAFILAFILLLSVSASATGMLTNEQRINGYYTLINTYIGKGDYENALVYIDRCLEIAGEENGELVADLYLKKGCMFALLERYDESIETLKTAIDMNPAASDAHLVSAQIYIERGDTQSAITSLENYLALVPDDTAMMAALAELYASVSSFDDALAYYTSYIDKAENPDASAYYMRGVCYLQGEQYPLAIADFSMAVDSADYHANSLYNRGVCYLQTGDYANAKADFFAVSDMGAAIDGLLYNRGLCQMVLGEYEAAAADFAASYAENQYPADSAYNSGMCNMNLTLYEQAVEDFTRYLEHTDNEADMAFFYRGVCNLSGGIYQAAIDDFTACLEMEIQVQDSLYNRALAKMQMSDYAGAIGDFDACVADENEVQYSLYYKAACAMSLTDYQMAADAYTAFIDRIPEGETHELLAACYYNRSLCNIELGNNDQAQTDMEYALMMDAMVETEAPAAPVIGQGETGAPEISVESLPNDTIE